MMELTTIWFILVGVLLTGFAILDGFDLGVGILSLFSKSDDERRLHVNAIGPVWDGNEVWLLTGGGALFAAFPVVYATVFEGLYLALMLVLAALIFRAVSMEFRGKVDSPAWRRVWDWAFGLGSLVAALLFGVAVGNILRGLPIDGDGAFQGTFIGLLNPYSLLAGVTGLAMLTMHGALYMALKSDGELRDRMGSCARVCLVLFICLLAPALVWTWFGSPIWGGESGKGSLAFVGLLLPAVVFLAALVALLKGGKASGRAFIASSGLVASVMFFAFAGLFPRLVPSSIDPAAYSLTVENSSSSALTLKVMLIVALTGMPLVVGYQAFIYRIFRGKVEIGEDSY